MALRRTTVFADEGDLAVLKAAAARRGVPEAELIRHGIHLAAMASQSWSDPFFSATYLPVDPSADRDTAEVLESVRRDQVDAYEATKHRRG